jgi:hypothetical protein
VPEYADYVLPGKLVDITAVEIIGEYRLRLTFEDGVVGDVGFADREWKGVFEPLRDPERFARVSIEFGTLAWPDDGLDMAPEPLYEKACANRVTEAIDRAIAGPPEDHQFTDASAAALATSDQS